MILKDKRYIYCLLMILSLFTSCFKGEGINGYWCQINYEEYNIEGLTIKGEDLVIVDCFGICYEGKVNQKNSILEIKIGDDHITNIGYEIKDTLLILDDSVRMIKKLWEEDLLLPSKPVDLLGLDTDVTFPYKGFVKDKYINIKLRNSNFFPTPFQLRESASKLLDLYYYAPMMICSGGRAKSMNYDGAIIFIEKEVLVKDLLVLEQFLFLNNHISQFILVTDISNFGLYQVVIDKRLVFPTELLEITEQIDTYTGKKNPPTPQPPVDENHTLENYLESNNLELIRLEGKDDFLSKKYDLLRNRREVILKLSRNMLIEEYMYILNEIQVLRLIENKSIKVHILD